MPVLSLGGLRRDWRKSREIRVTSAPESMRNRMSLSLSVPAFPQVLSAVTPWFEWPGSLVRFFMHHMIGSRELILEFEPIMNGTGGALWETASPSVSTGAMRGNSVSRSLGSSAGGSLSPVSSSLSLNSHSNLGGSLALLLKPKANCWAVFVGIGSAGVLLLL